ncbi:MAG: fumarylacetoacetate hydrolase family protein [Kutzneria sp.]|nr:fumarylacetoacetate hydrolase family protein [Kutzneria sp.]MBV9844781.1 fumarylacetoacetate hydrolase family protein [Kutzneria sp.]
MLICRFSTDGRQGYGQLDGAQVIPLAGAPFAGPPRPCGRPLPLAEVSLLPPVTPTKIVCVVLNYANGAHPHLRSDVPRPPVLKPPSSVAGPGDCVPHPGEPWQLKHEAELAVVIGVGCKDVTVERAIDVVAGYTCANDITAYAPDADADTGGSGFRGAWAKHFDAFCPLGPWLATDLDHADLEVTCRVDGEVRQHGSTKHLIMSVPEVIAQVSEHMTLVPGDVILTGTPAGSGPLHVGHQVEVSISGIGTLRNGVSEGIPL